jgi:hypothetical protein
VTKQGIHVKPNIRQKFPLDINLTKGYIINMKTYSVYLSYLTFNKGYRTKSISFKDIVASDIISAGEIAKEKASKKVKNNLMPCEISMIWYNV